MRLRLSASADDDNWATETTLNSSGNATYMQLHRVAARIWMLYRVGDSTTATWHIRYSDDEGATWTSERTLGPNTYTFSVLQGGVLYCFAYDHPVNNSDHDVYFYRVDLIGGDVTDSAGTVLGNVISNTGLPTTRAEQHKAANVSDPTTTRFYEAYKGATPAFVISEFEDENAGNYCRYVYNGAATTFTRTVIATSGPAFLASGSQYFGGVAFDESDIDTVYCARNLGASVGVGSWELVKMIYSGGSWQRSAVIRKSTNIIARPQVKHGRLWWSEMSSYVEYTDYASTLRSIEI